MRAPFPRFSRPALSARISALQGAVDALSVQAGYDGRGEYGCLGAMRRELIALEARRRAMDGHAAQEVSAPAATRMSDTLRTRGLPFQRHRPASPYPRLAQELGYARVKTARDQITRPYTQVAVTNTVLRAFGLDTRVCELMGVVDASLVGAIPPLAEALYRHNCADAQEDLSQAEWVKNTSDQNLDGYIKKLSADIYNAEILRAALIRERDERRKEHTR